MRTFYLFIFLFIAQLNFAQDFSQISLRNIKNYGYAVGNLNQDSFPDIFMFDYQGNNQIDAALLMHTGEDTIAYNYIKIEEDFKAVGEPAIGDFDMDGDNDILYTIQGTYYLFQFTNDGNGTFTKDSLGITTSEILEAMDVDNDGDLDVACYSTNRNSVHFLLNQGDGSFVKKLVFFTSDPLDDVAFGDLDGDLDIDVAMVFNQNSGTNFSYLINNGPTFEETVLMADKFSGPSLVKMGDLNFDGNTDLIINNGRSAYGQINDGNLNFTEKYIAQSQGSPVDLRSIEIADVTGDGVVDLFLGSNSDGVFFIRNLSAADLSYSRTKISNISPSFEIRHADLDNDGDNDLIIDNGDFWILENNIEQIPLGLHDLEVKVLDIFPNPVTAYIQIKDQQLLNSAYFIFNSDGRLCKEGILDSNSIETSNLEAGHYILLLKSKKENEFYRSTFLKF
ncbi:MAG: T9SS type A sorting domain-containing protein [Saprospiraceae bacterium]|nr:T9SS type A sorting domain-containing protein [Saprospiraceae bacterium]